MAHPWDSLGDQFRQEADHVDSRAWPESSVFTVMQAAAERLYQLLAGNPPPKLSDCPEYLKHRPIGVLRTPSAVVENHLNWDTYWLLALKWLCSKHDITNFIPAPAIVSLDYEGSWDTDKCHLDHHIVPNDETTRTKVYRGIAKTSDAACRFLGSSVAPAAIEGVTATGGRSLEEEQKNVFLREGEFWTVSYEGKTVRLKDSKGTKYVAELLRNPGTRIHALQLSRTVDKPPPVRPSATASLDDLGGDENDPDYQPDLSVSDGQDAGQILDHEAKDAYRERLRELAADLDEAERNNDPGQQDKAEKEIDEIKEAVAAAYGIGGRDRKVASHAERARVNITKQIGTVLKKLEKEHPQLHLHLKAWVFTGTYFSYEPDAKNRVDWAV